MWGGVQQARFISFRELLPRIIVKDPVTHDSWDSGRFTTYLICIKKTQKSCTQDSKKPVQHLYHFFSVMTEHPAFHLRLSAVRRRYSELRWLYKMMKANHPHIHFPKPPAKKVFTDRFELEFINSRTSEIQEFLNQLLVTDTVLSDAAFHFFVQTDLTPHEIEEHLNGTLKEEIIQEAWENAGHLHSSSYIVNSTTIPHEPQEIIMNEEDLQPPHHTSRSLNSSDSDSSFHSSAFLLPEDNNALSVLEESSAHSVPQVNSTPSVSEDNSALSVPEVNSTLSVPEVNSALSVPEANSTPSVSEDNSAHSVPQVNSAHSVPQVNSTPSVSEDNSALSVPEVNSALSVPEVNSALSVPEVNSALSVPEANSTLSEDNSALSVPEGIHSLLVHEDNSFPVPETTSPVFVSETKHAFPMADTTDTLPVSETRDVIFNSPEPSPSSSDETVDLANQNDAVSSSTVAVATAEDIPIQECLSELEDRK